MTQRPHYLVALSGGADSVALLLWLLEKGEAAAAAHCNFNLRGDESDGDEAFVRRLCDARGVKLYVAHFDTRAEAARCGESIEMAARRLRYAWFARLCSDHGYDAVAVAHHREDNAETLLLNLVRGTGLHGLTGMQAVQPGIVRPLLTWSRDDIEHYLKTQGQTFVTDSTNTDTHYKRNALRHEVLPLLARLNPQIIETLNATARRLSEATILYNEGLNRLRAQMVKARHDGLTIDLKPLSAHPAAATLLHEWLAPYGFTTDQLTRALTMRRGALLETGEWLLTRQGDTLEIRRRPPVVDGVKVPTEEATFYDTGDTSLHIGHTDRAGLKALTLGPHLGALDAAKLCGQLTLRSVRPGDRFSPLGLKGSKLVSDYLTDRHRSRIDKLAALAVCDDAGIVWLVGERIDRRVAISAATAEVVVLRVKYSEPTSPSAYEP